MGLFDLLVRGGTIAAPAITAGMQGQRLGEEERRKRAIEEEEREDAKRKRALELAILATKTEGDGNQYEYRGRRFRTAQELRDAMNLIEPPKPPEPRNLQIETHADGTKHIVRADGTTVPLTHNGQPFRGQQPTPPQGPRPNLPEGWMWDAGKGMAVQIPGYTPTLKPGGQIGNLPVDVQKIATQVRPAFDALARYEELTREFLQRDPFERGAGEIGLAGQDQDLARGQIGTVKSALLLSMKELAALGVLTGPDVGIVMEMIGDPLSFEALYRDPEFTLGKFAEARRYLQSRVDAYNQLYGLNLGGAGATPRVGPTTDAPYQPRHPDNPYGPRR